jgi:hypothetical protein
MSNPDPCHDSDLAGKRVWNDETRLSVRARVGLWSGEVGGEVVERTTLEITSAMDRIADDWARMRRSVCRDYLVRRTLDGAEYQTRVDCLDRTLVKERAFLAALEHPQVNVSTSLHGIESEMERCH